MSCAQLVELVTDFLDGTLDPDTSDRFEEHLRICDGCDTYIEQFRRTIDTLGSLPEAGLPEDARDALLNAFRDWPR
ncbi:Transmembrane anti-sigma factor [Kibdelosporangium sp. 4NS15]|uniref:Transmembrane anti-sigma factor n=1 Tax=Kibdelosporangium persicum TaxID=2698649 RepID=A0ABX2EV15_9PSEU|nr:zf-HC2 domain-containing protein [Kibdelosporangium persicum]NRN62860.1 Transmembrane anti-sigma factor [Kibdelosporangium persicum]